MSKREGRHVVRFHALTVGRAIWPKCLWDTAVTVDDGGWSLAHEKLRAGWAKANGHTRCGALVTSRGQTGGGSHINPNDDIWTEVYLHTPWNEEFTAHMDVLVACMTCGVEIEAQAKREDTPA